jgi:uncharacterized protein
MLTIDDLRAFAVTRSLFTPTTLDRAIRRIGFVQADPIRAPARAQDLILRHRVRHYRAGDLERRYASLDVEEDYFVNYGFLPREVWAAMHPRRSPSRWLQARRSRAQALLEFVRSRGTAHPREVDSHFSHGSVTNYWGGSSNATTHLLTAMHYGGLLRVVGRDRGIRLYAAHEHAPAPLDAAARAARIDTLVDVVVRTYAPLPAPSLSMLISRLRYAAPQWRRGLRAALTRARARLAHARVDGVEWYWPARESAAGHDAPDTVRFLAPFDPVVWDRRRFELFWKWTYRFEAYTPLKKRKLGYYALPMLWQDRIVGWANVSVEKGKMAAQFGYVTAAPRERAFARELEAEVERMRVFLR